MSDSSFVEVSPTKRARQRNPGEIRPLCFKMGISSSCSGSSFVSLGRTRIMCFVNSPKPPAKKSTLDIGQIILEVHNRCGSFTDRMEDHFRSMLLEAFERHVILEQYPRQIIEAWVTIEEDDSGIFIAALMGLSLAFVDAGIQVYDIVSACSVYTNCDCNGNYTIALDMNSDEIQTAKEMDPGHTCLHLAYCPNLNTVAYMLCTGQHMNDDILNKMLTMGQAACDVVSAELVSLLKNHYNWKSERPDALETADPYISDVTME